MILSIIIITHNQEVEFRRCINSILAMNLPFEYEIIVSDDASTDRSWELILSYSERFPNIIHCYQCDSNACHPSMISERAGYNRLNAVKHASGKYLYHIDGDDYLISNDCLKKHVFALDAHPECTISCQRYLWKEDNTPIDQSNIVFSESSIFSGTVLSADDFIREIPYIHNSACCVRNSDKVDPHQISGYEYDDIDITFQYIQKGKVILSDGCGFVYCHHNSNSASNFQSIGQTICWLTSISNSLIAPQCTGSLLRNGLSSIHDTIRYIKIPQTIDREIEEYLAKSKAFIFWGVKKRHNRFIRLRYTIALIWCKMIKKFHLNGAISFRILYLLTISFKVPQEANFRICSD